MKKESTCCLTGHRPKLLQWKYNEFGDFYENFVNKVSEILESLIKKGVSTFLTGMAEGFDMIATEILINLRKQYKHIQIIAVLPCQEQEKFWSTNQQCRYHIILKACNRKIVLSEKYSKACMFNRNKFMIEKSLFVVACYDGVSKGGTYNTIQMAKRNGCNITTVNPNKK